MFRWFGGGGLVLFLLWIFQQDQTMQKYSHLFILMRTQFYFQWRYVPLFIDINFVVCLPFKHEFLMSFFHFWSSHLLQCFVVWYALAGMFAEMMRNLYKSEAVFKCFIHLSTFSLHKTFCSLVKHK